MFRLFFLVSCGVATSLLSGCFWDSEPEKLQLEFPDVRSEVKQIATNPSTATYPKALSYGLGYNDVQERIDYQPLDTSAYLQGALDALLGREKVVDSNTLGDLESRFYIRELPYYLFERSKKQWKSIGNQEGIQSNNRGFYYNILRPAKDPDSPTFKLTDFVRVYFRAYLLSRQEVLSYDSGKPMVARVRDLPIVGFVLRSMKEGSIWRAYMPYSLAFGPLGARSVPPYSIVVFEIEAVERTQAPESYSKPNYGKELTPFAGQTISPLVLEE